jgi:hypothetical protein
MGGYGYINDMRNSGKHVKVHRLAWELKHGPIPVGKDVLHKRGCFNRNCVLHLYLGDTKANSDDKVADGRQARGDTSGAAKLSSKAVLAIRKSRLTNNALAKRYKVSQSAISQARTGKLWKHLPGAATRRGFGETCGRAVLTEKDVLAIRASKKDKYELAEKYGVTKNNIHAIRTYKTWRHLP